MAPRGPRTVRETYIKNDNACRDDREQNNKKMSQVLLMIVLKLILDIIKKENLGAKSF